MSGGRVALGVALVAALAACGDGAPATTPRSPSPSATTAPAADGRAATAAPPTITPDPAPLREDRDPWPDAPDGPAWEACAWVPAGGTASLWAFELESVRAHPAAWQRSSAWHAAVDARRRWVRDLRLPLEALTSVVAVSEPSGYAVLTTSLDEKALTRGLEAAGYVAVPLDDRATGWRYADGESPVAAVVDGRVLTWVGGDEVLRTVLDVRRGRATSLREAEGVREACAAAPKRLPFSLDAGAAPRRRGPAGAPPPPVATIGVVPDPARQDEVRVVVARKESERATYEALFRRVWSGRFDPRPDDVASIGARGRLLRFTTRVGADREPGRTRRAAEALLRPLREAILRRVERDGAPPPDLASLAAPDRDAASLDDLLGLLPSDPWGRPFAYQAAHPKSPDGFLVRSLGPDGEPDTEDDVLPAR